MAARLAALVAVAVALAGRAAVAHGPAPGRTFAVAFARAPASADLALGDPAVAGRGGAAPEQVHVALAGPGALAISWVTGQASYDAALDSLGKKREPLSCEHLEQVASSVVVYGTQSGAYASNATGSHVCYVADNYASGQLHHVVIGLGEEGPLQPRTTYFYTCGDPEFGMSDEFAVTTAPTPGVASLPYRLGLIGDLGQTRNSQETLQHVIANQPESVLNVGDLSYADGNHEEEMANGEKGFLAYETRFWFPSKASKSGSPFYYSYEVAGAHIVMLGCYVDYDRESAQYEWLKTDLASVDRQRTPWLLVGMHAPWYNSNEAHQGEMDDMLADMEDLLFQFGVDAVFAGHVHAYERSVRTYKGVQNDCGPVYIVIGDGGNREGLATDYLAQPEWSAFREASFGHGILDILNATHAVWQWHRNQDALPVISDEVVLERTTECSGAPLAAAAHAPVDLAHR